MKTEEDEEREDEEKMPESPQPSSSKHSDCDAEDRPSTSSGITRQIARQTDYVDVLVKTIESALSTFES